MKVYRVLTNINLTMTVKAIKRINDIHKNVMAQKQFIKIAKPCQHELIRELYVFIKRFDWPIRLKNNNKQSLIGNLP